MALSSITNQMERDKFVLNSDDETAVRVVAEVSETTPISDNRANPSQVLAYTGENLTSITETVDGTEYIQTLTYDDDDNLIGISSWSEV